MLIDYRVAPVVDAVEFTGFYRNIHWRISVTEAGARVSGDALEVATSGASVHWKSLRALIDTLNIDFGCHISFPFFLG
jgi:hypothetical protein